MGAEVQYYNVKCKRSELNSKAEELRDDARHDHGHSGYTGTIAEDGGGVNLVNTPMSEEDAEEYIDENAEKWENSLAIPILDKEDEFLIGGCYSC